MRGRSRLGSYHWPRAQVDLAQGIHPEVVAARMGVHVSDVLATADEQRWPVSYRGPAPDDIIDRTARELGL